MARSETLLTIPSATIEFEWGDQAKGSYVWRVIGAGYAGSPLFLLMSKKSLFTRLSCARAASDQNFLIAQASVRPCCCA
jgi:hypothetical protein